MDQDNLLNDYEPIPDVAPALGAFLIDFNELDHQLTYTLAILTEGPARTFDGALFDIFQPLNIGLRVDLLSNVINEWQKLGFDVDVVDLFNDLRNVVRRRNRLMHDYYQEQSLGDNELGSVRIYRTGPGKKESVQEFSVQDLMVLRETVRNLKEKLESLESDFD